MSTPPRCFVPGVSVHVIQRGNNRMPIFARAIDCERYLTIVRYVMSDCEVDVHGFIVMTTHSHLIVTPSSKGGLPRAMARIGIRYTQYYNRHHGRIGTPWNERYKGFPIGDERYWLTCLRYIEQNPVRAHMVTDPGEYRWSSYRVHAFGEPTEWLVPHAVYLALGATPAARQAAYRAMCGVALDESELTLQRRPPKRSSAIAALAQAS